MNFTRYTVILGGYDALQPTPHDGICVTDDTSLGWGRPLVSGWVYHVWQRSARLGWDNKTASRYPKIKPHVFLDCEHTVYHDGSVRLLVPPERFLKYLYLGEADIAAFLHPQRDCVYDEGAVCAECGAAHSEAVTRQMDDYRKDGYRAHNGLHAATLLVRRSSARMNSLSRFWWDQFLKYDTRRDQLSFDYCLWKLGIKCATIPGNLWDNELMDVGHHAERR